MMSKYCSSLFQFSSTVALACAAILPAHSQVTYVTPSRGGGMDTTSPMIHVDVSYDSTANEMQATVDTTYGIPNLVSLPEGYAFDPAMNYSVLGTKAYNFQYAWNPGGVFTPPEGAAVWIECLSISPGLENYDGPGNKMENPPRTYAPILGTAGSLNIWKWYGRMAHNAYAIQDPTTDALSASYRVYFGDAVTGARDAYLNYDDALVTLNFSATQVPEPSTYALLLAGGALFVLGIRRRQKSHKA